MVKQTFLELHSTSLQINISSLCFWRLGLFLWSHFKTSPHLLQKCFVDCETFHQLWGELIMTGCSFWGEFILRVIMLMLNHKLQFLHVIPSASGHELCQYNQGWLALDANISDCMNPPSHLLPSFCYGLMFKPLWTDCSGLRSPVAGGGETDSWWRSGGRYFPPGQSWCDDALDVKAWKRSGNENQVVLIQSPCLNESLVSVDCVFFASPLHSSEETGFILDPLKTWSPSTPLQFDIIFPRVL